jgi:hypothetical protein
MRPTWVLGIDCNVMKRCTALIVVEEELVELAEVGRGRKAKKKAAPRQINEFAPEDRDDKRRKRRWEAPPHKRISDYDQG